jgi:hypothetical protein
MSKVNENMGVNSIMQRGDFMRGIPFYGTKGDFNFTLGRSQFTPGVSIKQLPLTDMSHKADPGRSELDNQLSLLKMYYKPGDRIRGIEINSQIDGSEGRFRVGKLVKFTPDYTSGCIRAWLKNPKTLEEFEIYPDTMERVYESSNRALSFSQFINS